MRFYTQRHLYTYGIDLHTRSMSIKRFRPTPQAWRFVKSSLAL